MDAAVRIATLSAPDGLEFVATYALGKISVPFSCSIKGVQGAVYDEVSFGRALEKM